MKNSWLFQLLTKAEQMRGDAIPHIIFLISILALASLVTWWSVFINRSINQHRAIYMETLELQLKYFALKLGMDNKKPGPGVFQYDGRFEITLNGTVKEPLKKSLKPLWPNLCIKIRTEVTEDIEKDYRRKKLMLTGESLVLVLIVMLGSVLLYRYIKLGKRSTREVEEFWGRVTHEIKTPITGIKAFLQSIKNKSLPPDQLPLFVDMALKQVIKQEQLAENILAGYGLRSKDRDYRATLKDFDLHEFINDYFYQHAILLTDAKLILQLDNTANPGQRLTLTALADSHLLKVIMDNIVDNAVKYCSPGLELTVKVYSQNKKAIISIRDNGPGIHPDFSGKVFNAYKHLNNELPGKLHGSGIGLHISRRLAEKMLGQLELIGKGAGYGTEFLLILNLSKTHKRAINQNEN
jgi:signal transduction histidine kinase